MVDVAGLELDAADRELLGHPAVGGVVLFARNFASRGQLVRLVRSIHAQPRPRLLVCVDQEGGRVQRFTAPFTDVPAAGRLGRLSRREPERARSLAAACGWVLATELRAAGIDIDFAPVLDLAGVNAATIGERAFDREPSRVSELARALLAGLQRGGMRGVGKHFPGHGGAEGDTHSGVVVDRRALSELENADLSVYRGAIAAGIGGVMASHVVFPEVDPQPVGFSRVWLREVLRRRLGFAGTVFSDDLAMFGASPAGGLEERVGRGLAAGCDMVLACNDRAGVEALLGADGDWSAGGSERAVRVRCSHPGISIARAIEIRATGVFRAAVESIERFAAEG